jgi:hypothetical protein
MAEREEDMIITPSPNLGSLFAGLSRTIAGVQDKRREEKEKLEVEALDTYNTIAKDEAGKDPFFQDLIYNGLASVKDNMLAWNKQRQDNLISAAEYKRRVNNVTDGQNAVNENSLNFDKVIAQGFKRQDDGDQGDLEATRYQRFADNSKLKGQEEYIDPLSGEVYLVRRDVDGNIISQQNSKRLGGQTGGLNSTTTDLAKSINDKVTDWRGNQILKEDGSIVTNLPEDKRELFNQGKATLIAQLTREPEGVWSILADNGVTESTEYGYVQTYESYYNKEGKKKLIENRLEDAKIALATDRMVIKKDDDGNDVLGEDGNVEYDVIKGREMTKEEEDQFKQDQENFLFEMIDNEVGQLVPNTKSKNWLRAKKKAIQTISDEIDLRIGAKRSKPTPERKVKTTTTKKPKQTSGEYDLFVEGIESKNYKIMESIMVKDYTVKPVNDNLVIIFSEKQNKANRNRGGDGEVARINPNIEREWFPYTTMNANKIKNNKLILEEINKSK